MFGLMQDWSLLIHRVIDHASAQHGNRPVISAPSKDRCTGRPMRRSIAARRIAKRLERDGIRLGDRVATLAWNTWRHLESWYGITGIGAIYHTVNPRLFEDQIVYIMNHAEDRVLMLDLTFVPLMEKLQERLPTVERFIVFTDADHMPPTTLRNAVAESWLAEADEDFTWASFDENTAAGLCYTSGTTGEPKGVLYSHRSNVLHALSNNNRISSGCRPATWRCPSCRSSTPTAGPSPSRRPWRAPPSSFPARNSTARPAPTARGGAASRSRRPCRPCGWRSCSSSRARERRFRPSSA